MLNHINKFGKEYGRLVIPVRHVRNVMQYKAAWLKAQAGSNAEDAEIFEKNGQKFVRLFRIWDIYADMSHLLAITAAKLATSAVCIDDAFLKEDSSEGMFDTDIENLIPTLEVNDYISNLINQLPNIARGLASMEEDIRNRQWDAEIWERLEQEAQRIKAEIAAEDEEAEDDDDE